MKNTILFLTFFSLIFNCKSQSLIESQQVYHDIDSIKEAYHIPGLVFGVADTSNILICGGLGVRKINTTDSVKADDYFHIASLGKGLTSFMIGKLIDEGKIDWETRFFDLYPELRKTSEKEYHDLRLRDLLSMRTRLRSLNDWSVKQTIEEYNKKYPEDRFSYYKFAAYALTLEPVQYDSGQFYNYTSMGYVLANLMLQKASGLNYAQLLEKTNKDLGVNFVIGWPQTISENQPSGHLIPTQAGWGESNTLEVINGDSFTDWGEDFLFYNIPSGHHSVRISDYLKYLQSNLNGLKGFDNYLKSETYHTIFNGAKEYSMGWGNDMVDNKHYYSHSGSVGNFMARAIIIKESNIVIAIFLNAGNGETIGGMHQMIHYLEKKYATQ